METEIITIDEYHYKGFWNCECICKLTMNKNIVICEELDANTGTSVTNAAEILIDKVCREFHIDIKKLRWFEVNGDCSEVVYQNLNINWIPINKVKAFDILKRGE